MKKFIYTIALSSFLFSCKDAKTEETAPINDGLISVTATQFQSSGMEIASPKEEDFNLIIKTSGKIDVPPQNRAKVTTFIGGYVKTTSWRQSN